MDSFIKKVWNKNCEEAHYYFVRFGKGNFSGKAALNLQKSNKIKLGGSFEWAKDFAIIVAELNPNAKFSGIILSKENLSEFNGKKKSGINEYLVENINSSKVLDLKDKVYVFLLDCENSEITLKSKKKLPKPGKSGNAKIEDKFCQIEADLKYWDSIKAAFMLPDCKKCKLSHTFIIEQIIPPKDEKDFEKARILAKRKGRILRNSIVDKKEFSEEIEFEA